MMDDWDKVSAPAEEPKVTNDWDAVSTAPQPRTPPPVKRRRNISGASIAIVILCLAVIGQAVFIGLNVFHIVKFNNVNVGASTNEQPTSVAINANLAATVQAQATILAQDNATITAQPTSVAVNSKPAGTYLGTTGCPTNGANFWIVNAKTGLLVDVAGASKASGGVVVQYPDDGGLNQVWSFHPAGTAGNFKIVNVNSGLVLDAPFGSSGTGVIQNPDNGGLSQQWQCISIGSNYFKVVNAGSSLVLDVASTNLAQIAYLYQNPYTGGLNQQWLFVS